MERHEKTKTPTVTREDSEIGDLSKQMGDASVRGDKNTGGPIDRHLETRERSEDAKGKILSESLPTGGALYVGNLAPDVNETQLLRLFSEIGDLLSLRLCRDIVTKRSLGYGYVNYVTKDDAARAIDVLNYYPAFGRELRVIWSLRDPSKRSNKTSNIFVKNLIPDITSKDLHDTFEEFGNILSCKVEYDEAGVSRGFGFVQFEEQASADAAIKRANGTFVGGKKIYASLHLSSGLRKEAIERAKRNFTSVYIKGFGEEVDEAQLQQLFEPYGEVQSAYIKRDESGNSQCFGFVSFASSGCGLHAVEALHGADVGGKTVYVSRAMTKAERLRHLREEFEKKKMDMQRKYRNSNLYVRNLDESIDSDGLKALFQDYGEIKSACVMRDAEGASRKFGFLCFETPESAKLAIQGENGRLLNRKPLYVCLAEPKLDRQRRLAEEHRRNIIKYSEEKKKLLLPSGKLGEGQLSGERRSYKTARILSGRRDSGHPKRYESGRPYVDARKDTRRRDVDGEKSGVSLSELAKIASPEERMVYMQRLLAENVSREIPDDAEMAGRVSGALAQLSEEEMLDLLGTRKDLQEKVSSTRSALLREDARRKETGK
ncbi:MAG: polyadenylate-binding protein [Amphiamblys sp. WSBS2006]|nr:MAG: polyadenylate-binding protein [Amphiamblys sp. WSBS2006]